MRHSVTQTLISAAKPCKNYVRKGGNVLSFKKKEGITENPNLLRSSNPTSRSGNTLPCNLYLPCFRLHCSDTGRNGGQTAMICNIIFIPRTLHYQIKTLPFFLLNGTTPILVQCHLKLSVILFELKSGTVKMCVHL